MDKISQRLDLVAHCSVFCDFPLSVSRLVAQSEAHGMHLALDYNTELYPLVVGAQFTLTLASSLSRVVDTDDSDARNVWRPDDKGRAGIEKDYDYVMYGKVCSFSKLSASNILVLPLPRCTSSTMALLKMCKHSTYSSPLALDQL